MNSLKIFIILLTIIIVIVFITNTTQENHNLFNNEYFILITNINTNNNNNNILTNITTNSELYYADTNLESIKLNWIYWGNLNTHIANIAISNYNFCYISLDNILYYCNDYRNPIWKNIDIYVFNGISSIDIYNNIIILTSNNFLFYVDCNLQLLTLTQITGYISQCAISNNQLYGVNNDSVWYCSNYKNPNWINVYTNLDNKLVYVDFDNNVVIGINTLNKLVYADNNLSQPIWKEILGDLLFSKVSICNGKVYAITTTDEIYYRVNYKLSHWIKVNTSLTELSLLLPSNDNTVVGLNLSGEIYYITDIVLNPKWTQIRPSINIFKKIIISNNKIYALTTNNILFYSNNFVTPEWTYINRFVYNFEVDNNIIVYINTIDLMVYYVDTNINMIINNLIYKAKQIAISNNQLYCIYNKQLNYYLNFKTSQPILINNINNNIFYYIAIENNVVACITANKKLYYAINNLANPTWINIPTSLILSSITIVNSNLYGKNKSEWKYIINISSTIMQTKKPIKKLT